MTDKAYTGHIAALVTILIWGTTFISTKVLLGVFSPVEILFIRFAIGYAALWCVRPRLMHLAQRRQEWYFAAAGLCGVTLYYLLENIALSYTLASNVGVIISVAPFFTALFAFYFLREGRPGPRFFFGFLIAIAGVFLISFRTGAALQVNPLGDFLALVAAVVWAGYSTLMKKISGFGYNTICATRRTFFYGLVFMLPTLFFSDFHLRPAQFTDAAVLWNLLFLGLGASALCFVTWNMALGLLGPVKTTVYIYLVPIITAVTSALVLHESITPVTVCGIVLTLTGLILSEKRLVKKEI